MNPAHLKLRAARPDDLDALLAFAAASAVGIGTLRPERDWMAERIARSQHAFATQDDASGEEIHLFVLEDEGTRRAVGCSGIAARAGFGARFFSYRNEFVVASSPALNLTQRTHTLHLCHDLSDATLLTSFYIEPAYAEGAAPQLLSRGRLLFLHAFAERFSERIAAESPGALLPDGRSPVWDALGRRFFGIDYPEVEALAGGRSKAFIAELLPQSPIYVPLLPEAAQRAIGQLHPDGELPFGILLAEGFDADSYIDVFDGGPTVDAPLRALASVRAVRALLPGAAAWQIACNGRRDGFCARLIEPGLDAATLVQRLDCDVTPQGWATPLELA